MSTIFSPVPPVWILLINIFIFVYMKTPPIRCQGVAQWELGVRASLAVFLYWCVQRQWRERSTTVFDVTTSRGVEDTDGLQTKPSNLLVVNQESREMLLWLTIYSAFFMPRNPMTMKASRMTWLSRSVLWFPMNPWTVRSMNLGWRFLFLTSRRWCDD